MDRDYLEALSESLSRGPSEAERKRRAEEARLDREEVQQVRQQIAQLGRDYPLYVCSNCHHLDGWVDQEEGGLCLRCLGVYPFFHQVEEPLLYDSMIGSLILNRRQRYLLGRALRRLSDPRPPWWARVLALLGAPGPYRRRALKSWRRHVDWPEQPPLGTEIPVWGAEKFETVAPGGEERLVVFKCGWYWWQGGRFRRWKVGPYSMTPRDVGSVFPASLPVEQLVSAWQHFQEAVNARNADDWKRGDRSRLKEREQKALAAQRVQDRQDRLRAQEGAADLL